MNKVIPIIVMVLVGVGLLIGALYLADYNNKLKPWLHSLKNPNPLPDGSYPNPPEISIGPTFS